MYNSKADWLKSQRKRQGEFYQRKQQGEFFHKNRGSRSNIPVKWREFYFLLSIMILTSPVSSAIAMSNDNAGRKTNNHPQQSSSLSERVNGTTSITDFNSMSASYPTVAKVNELSVSCNKESISATTSKDERSKPRRVSQEVQPRKKKEIHKSSKSSQLMRNEKIAKQCVDKVKEIAPIAFNKFKNGDFKFFKDKQPIAYCDGDCKYVDMDQLGKLFVDFRKIADPGPILKLLANYFEEDPTLQINSPPNKGFNDEKVTKLYEKFILEVNRVAMTLLHAQLAKKYGGGSCGQQASVAIVEAIIAGHSIEKVVLEDKDSPDHRHEFCVVGRKRNSKLANIETWGENAFIIDVWNYRDKGYVKASKIAGAEDNQSLLYNNENWGYTADIFRPKFSDKRKKNAIKQIVRLTKDYDQDAGNKFGRYLEKLETVLKNLLKENYDYDFEKLLKENEVGNENPERWQAQFN